VKSDNLVEFCIAQVHHSMPEDTALDVELQHALLMLTSLISATPALSDRVCRLAIEKMNKRYVEACVATLTKEQLYKAVQRASQYGDNVERFLGISPSSNSMQSAKEDFFKKFGGLTKPDEDEEG